MRTILATILLFFAGTAIADEVKTFTWTNATQHTDGTAYDPATQQAFTQVFCDGDDTVPAVTAVGAVETANQSFVPGTHSCYAKHVHVNGNSSDASNPTAFETPPPTPVTPLPPSGFGVN